MSGKQRHGRASYKRGCRCGLCKCAENKYRRALRKRHAEEAGLFAGPASPSLRLVRGEALTSENAPNGSPSPLANMVESAVAEEIGALGGHNRPGLEAVALALARLMDNPRVVSTQPAAAKVLVALLEKLRSVSVRGPRGGLALVRTMTEKRRDV